MRKTMKAKALGYWICTALIAFIFVSSGVFYVMRVPQVVEGVTHLGFPLHFVTLLGVWKVLGGIAILVPGFARVKEWVWFATTESVVKNLLADTFPFTSSRNATCLGERLKGREARFLWDKNPPARVPVGLLQKAR
jgi:uncharacterized membrane protein YphA (DoxX/SURF4 family)